jgi:phosphoglycolate phosphatase
VNLKEKKLIIFDLDGTLIDSGPDLAHSINLMLHKLSLEAYESEVIERWVGNGALMLVRRALSGSVVPDDTLDAEYVNAALKLFLELYSQNLCRHTTLYPNVKNTIQKLCEREYTLAIVTNKPAAFVPEILTHFGLLSYFSLILGGDSLDAKKPSPKPLLHVCEQLGFCVEESLMVGDSKNDIQAANAANMESVAVSYGYNYQEDIREFHPTLLIDDFGVLLDL